MLIEKKDVKKIINRLRKGKEVHSCQVGFIIQAKPTSSAFSYIFRKRYPVKCYGTLTFFADCKENMLPDLVRWKLAKFFGA